MGKKIDLNSSIHYLFFNIIEMFMLSITTVDGSSISGLQ